MAEKIVFKLKDPQKGVTPSNQKETLIFLIYNFGYFEQTEKTPTNKKGKKYIPLKYSTGLSIKPCFWNSWPHCRAKQTSQFEYEDFNTSLDDFQNGAKKVYREMKNEGLKVTPESLKQRLIVKFSGGIEPGNINLNQYIDKFIEDITTGNRLFEGRKYKTSTLKNFKGFKSQFKEFQTSTNRKYDFENITIDFYDKFVKFFNDKNYSPNTIGRHIKNLKTIMRAAREQGLHKNYEIDRKKFRTIKVEVNNIYLNLQELKQLTELDLTDYPNLALARDMFLIGCYTAQRFSDYSRIKKENIRALENGRKVIDLTQRKTGERVIIPIKPELELILEKYDYSTPKIYEQKLNKLIKEVAEQAGIDETITIESTKGGMKYEKRFQKYELISSHTCRRSACSNMYLAGIPSIDIMRISGHRTEKIFLSYINVTKEETAQNLSQHPYFNTNLRAVK